MINNSDNTVAGIGLDAAVKLAHDGFELILACRNQERGQTAVESIKKQLPGAKVTFMQVGLFTTNKQKELTVERTNERKNE